MFAQPTEGTDRKESQTMTIASPQLADQTVGQVLDTMDEIMSNPRQYLHDEEAQRYIAAAVEDVNVRDAYVATDFNDQLCSLLIKAHTYAVTPYAAANCLCMAAIACLEDTLRRDCVEEASYRDHDHTLTRLLLHPDYVEGYCHVVDNTKRIQNLHRGKGQGRARAQLEERRHDTCMNL